MNYPLFCIRPLTSSGNRDKSLDRGGSKFSQEALDLLTSSKLKENGVHYLDREARLLHTTQ